ncbi:hypothetical protein [Limosilactobacillus vaginalis]|uniref:hypothetical protein n=1 Tax=Limosilactobacillus vaginalis TaxID=1633 RepID=UPI0025A4A7D4|nr:hypothetical protein [Limosilactobacillus vaginalis]MDM8304302.1 hypothetical protein [Limosilactobacillus vaginalis]
MARRVWVTKRQPDLLTIMSTRRGLGQLSLVFGTSTLVLKVVELWLTYTPDPFGIYQVGALIIGWFSNITLGATLCLLTIYFFTIKSWLVKVIRINKSQRFDDTVKSLRLQHDIQSIVIDQMIGNPNLSQKSIIVPEIYVQAHFQGEVMMDGMATIDLVPGATNDIVQLGNDISASLVNKWNRSIVADDFEINSEQTQVTYFLFDTQAQNRLVITKDSDVPVINENTIKLMPGWIWQLAKEPHMNLMAETGFGKTYLANYIIYASVKSSIQVFYADPKKSSNLDHALPEGRVFFDKEEIIKSLERMVRLMDARNVKIKEWATSAISQDFTDLGLPAVLYVFDELSAFINSLDSKKNKYVISLLSQLLMKGRSAGIVLISIGQQLDAKTFPTKLRSQAQLNLILGPSTLETRTMLFGHGVDAPLTTFKPGTGLFTLAGMNTNPRRFMAPDMRKFEPVYLANLKRIANDTQSDWKLLHAVSRGNA